MPSTSEAQEKTMRAAAHSPVFARKVGIPTNVAKDFEAADKKKESRSTRLYKKKDK